MGIVIASQEKKKELDKNAKKIKRKKGQYAQQRLFFQPRTNLEGREDTDGDLIKIYSLLMW